MIHPKLEVWLPQIWKMIACFLFEILTDTGHKYVQITVLKVILMYQFRGAFIFIMMYIPILDHGWWKNISMRIFLKCIHRWRHKDRRKYRYYQHHCTRYMHIYDFILKELLKLVLCRDGAIWSWSPIISSQTRSWGECGSYFPDFGDHDWLWLIISVSDH